MSVLSRRTRAYVWGMLGLGSALVLWSLPSLPQTTSQWIMLGALTMAAGTSQLFPVVVPHNQAYYLSPVFVFAALLLLPPGGLALLVILCFVPEWIKHRYPWHIEVFNVCNLLATALAARAVYVWAGGTPSGPAGIAPAGITTDLAAAVLAAASFTVLNHLLVAVALHLLRGHSWDTTGLFDTENLFVDGTLCCTGIISALLLHGSLWMMALTAAPLFLIYRALNTSNLQQQARTDDKTGLYNGRHFNEGLKEELERSERWQLPLSVIMVDLDFLRNINNSYGHLAGDQVLRGIAQILKDGLRKCDIAARFGGEEFAILLPETDAPYARDVAERLRKQVENARFTIPTSAQPVGATISLGVATFPKDGCNPEELVHQADLAVYYAKLRGRNCAWSCSPESTALSPVVASRKGFSLMGQREPYNGCGNPNPQYVLTKDTVFASTSVPDGDAETGASCVKEGPLEDVRKGIFGTPSEETQAEDAELEREDRSGHRDRASDLTWPVASFVCVVLGVTLSLWLVHRPWQAHLDWLGIGALAVLELVAQRMALDVYGRGKVSTSAILILAGGILWGMPGVLLLAPVIGLATRVLRGGLLHRTLFDMGDTTLSGAAAVLVYETLSSLLPSPEHLLLVLPAACSALAYYVVNVGLLSAVMGIVERRDPVDIWNERFRWLLLHYLVYGPLALVITISYQAIGLYGLLVFFVPPVMLLYVMKQYIDHTRANIDELRRVNQQLVKAHDEVMATLDELRATHDATVKALSAALDSRDSETEGHCQRVVAYTEVIARELGLPVEEMLGLLNGALLHDVGKIGVPDAILRKPGSLTESEWQAMNKHPEQGRRMLQHIGFLRDALPVVRYHHERYDGSGYPEGLHGEEIPLGARIFAVADTFDAMTSHRPYRSACPFEDAREEIARHAGTQFDPKVVEAFLRVDVLDLVSLNAKFGLAGDAGVAGEAGSMRTHAMASLS